MFIMRKYEMLGFFIIGLISILLALLFWLLPTTFITNGIGPTNDSLWQIGKLMFFSIFIYSIIEYFIFGRKFDNFVFAKVATMFIAPLFYIAFSYILDMGMGDASINNHIIAYLTAIFVGQYASYYLLQKGYYFKLMNAYAVIGIILMLFIYIGYGNVTNSFDSPIFKPMNNYKSFIKYQS